MADERDRLRRQLGLAPLPTGRTDSAASVDERTQRAAMATASATPAPISTEPKRYYNYYTGEYVDDPSKIKPRTGMGGPESGGGRIQVSAYDDNADDDNADDDNADDDNADDDNADDNAGNGTKTIYTAPDGRIFTDLNAYNAYITKLKADEKLAKGESAFSIFRGFLAQYGLEGLAADVEKYKIDGLSDDELLIRLRTESTAYKNRFKANEARISKGLRALTEAQYIELEDQYQDVMRRYGLPESYYTRGEMGRQEGFEKFIAGDVSSVELEDRIQTAQRRVLNADPQIKNALTQFYGSEISNGDILAYVLDPAKAIENIKRKVTAAEIGGGALRAGLGVSRGRAEELGQYGVTKESAQQGFGTIASGLERGRQLSQIYNQPDYTQAVAESEVFALPDAEKARRQRRKLGQLETTTFSGTSGVTGGALDRERAGQY